MRKLFVAVIVPMFFIGSCSQKNKGNFVLVKGGKFINKTSNFYGKNNIMQDFYIGRYEITQKEWKEVMGTNPSEFKGDSLPVEMVSWYDCLVYCNKRSAKEGLQAYYNIDSSRKDQDNTSDLDDIKWTVTINGKANGYRLPTEAEWEYASGGGQLSKSYKYSGGNNIDEVAWYWKNSGDQYLSGTWSWSALEKNHNKTKAVGAKKPNELELYDMSGNVREWCWDSQGTGKVEDPKGRTWKGGGWIGADFCCEIFFVARYEANGRGPDQGLRVCRRL